MYATFDVARLVREDIKPQHYCTSAGIEPNTHYTPPQTVRQLRRGLQQSLNSPHVDDASASSAHISLNHFRLGDRLARRLVIDETPGRNL